MTIYVGTSGYGYKEWRGIFYPADLPEKGMLRYYGERFRAVEINNTFYRMPKADALEAWGREVPPHFRFVLKAPQRITHVQRLREVDDSVSHFFGVAEALGERLGAVLFQLPPALKKDLPLLRSFLALLPPGRRVALEFRHPSWFDEELFTLLGERNVALCIAESEELKVPCVATADWGYLRLRLPEYGAADLKNWLKRVRGEGWHDAFVFFKHEEHAKGPRFAQRFQELAG